MFLHFLLFFLRRSLVVGAMKVTGKLMKASDPPEGTSAGVENWNACTVETTEHFPGESEQPQCRATQAAPPKLLTQLC